MPKKPNPKTIAGIECLVEALGTDLHERWRPKVESWRAKPSRAKVAHLDGMVERVRQRRHRRGLGLPVAPLTDHKQCVICMVTESSTKKLAAVEYRQEYVYAHVDGCLAELEREIVTRIYPTRTGRSFYLY